MERLFSLIQLQSRPQKKAIVFGLIFLISGVDFLTGSNYTFFIFYLFPIVFSVWILDQYAGSLFIVFTVIWSVFLDYQLGCPVDKLLIYRWNGWTTIFMFFVAVLLVAKLKALFVNMELIIRKRTEELKQQSKQRAQLQEEVLEVSEREQQRVACDLHDVVCQYLTGISLEVKALEIELEELNLPQTEVLKKISSRVVQAIDLTRHCAEGLFPLELFSQNFTDIIHKTIEDFSKKCDIHFRSELDDSVIIQSQSTLLELYRITQEGVTNALKYSKAKEIVIRLHQQESWVRLEIEDDGIGFSEAEQTSGLGLRIMKYRANKIGAILQINRAEIKGTIVTCLWERTL